MTIQEGLLFVAWQMAPRQPPPTTTTTILTHFTLWHSWKEDEWRDKKKSLEHERVPVWSGSDALRIGGLRREEQHSSPPQARTKGLEDLWSFLAPNEGACRHTKKIVLNSWGPCWPRRVGMKCGGGGGAGGSGTGATLAGGLDRHWTIEKLCFRSKN